jgi:flavin reductase (DIM6/NTAB) family NADH-FMN oxidoreductase RutF
MQFTEIDLNTWHYILHPRPVVIVVSGGWEDYSAMPASWVTPVSRSPLVVAIAIARSRHTYSLILRYREFALCVLGAEHAKSIHILGSVSGRDVRDKIAYAGLSKARAKRVSCPIIAESLAVAECSLIRDAEVGDHNLVLGEVLVAYVRTGVRLLNTESYSLALHVGRNRYAKPSQQVVEV